MHLDKTACLEVARVEIACLAVASAVASEKLRGSMSGWSLECEPEHFTDVDTLWRMDDKLTWLWSDGDPAKTHVETLGDIISEAFYAHKRVLINAHKKSSTAAESSVWQTVKNPHCSLF